MRRTCTLLTAGALLAATPGLAAAPAAGANTPARAQALAKLPDWSGLWKTRGSFAVISRTDLVPFTKGNRDHPPYKPDWEARYAANILRAESQGDPKAVDPLIDSHTSYCAAGAVRLIASPFDYNFVVTPEATWILASGEVRQIYTDGRKFPPPDQMWPKFAGWSIGHWEGDTLVSETRGLKPEMWLDSTPMVLSEEAVVLERIRRIDAETLEDRVTITDPVAFTAPWSFTRHYTRQKDGMWGDEKEICGGPEDRNPIVNGRITIQLAPQK
jgi:hypothetical protein